MQQQMHPAAFQPDDEQQRVLAHDRGPLLVEGAPGTGKTSVVRERFARVIEAGADPERVGLVVRSKPARGAARRWLLDRLSRPLPGMKVMTVHGLAHHVMSQLFGSIGYERPPEVLTSMDQFSRVQELLAGEEAADWPAYGGMLPLRGFADQVRQFLLRSQEALLSPDQVEAKADEAGISGWRELARFYRRYLDVLHDNDEVDFAGLVNQAAAALSAAGSEATGADAPFDHLLVDDYQEATFAEEALVVRASARSLVVAGDADSHIFSFQGTTDRPIRTFLSTLPVAEHVVLATTHRGAARSYAGWAGPHTSEENAAVARELRRIHVEEGVPWSDLAVVVRRDEGHVGGLLRALDDAAVPRMTPRGGLSLMAEPATFPFVLALKWLARPEERDSLAEGILTSDLVRLSPAAARGAVRAATSTGSTPRAALAATEGLSPLEAAEVAAVREALDQAEPLAGRSVLDAFRALWRRLPYACRLVEEAERSSQGQRDLDAVLAFSEAVGRAGERADASVHAFLELLEGGREGPGLADVPGERSVDAVRVLTAHATAGLEFDSVLVVGATEGNFPSLARPEPMFDLAALEGPISQSERNRLRLADERRLFHVVATRARRRVVFTASDPHGEATVLTARSRFVSALGVPWTLLPAHPLDGPLSRGEAAASWRRTLSDPQIEPARRLAALAGLLVLGSSPGRWWFQRDWTGSDRPMHEGIRVSYSKLSTLENCSLQYVLSEELGLEGQAGYYAWVGHLVHSIIEDCENGLVDRTEDGLVLAAQERWQPKEFPSFAVSEAFRRLVTTQMLPAWLAAYGETKALAPEMRFEFEFDGATVSGAIDRISPAGSDGCQITDYKSGKSRSAPQADENLQLGIYYLALSRVPELAAFGRVKQVELAFLRERTLEGMVKRVQLGMNSGAQKEFGEKMSARLSSLIDQIRELYRTDTYQPSPAADCRYCDFKSLCPLWPEGRELFPVGARP
jgi:superfamily I DNA/RNA helicase/RecB family exonuclease